MPVDTTHPDYTEWISEWTKCRDVIVGSRKVKEKGETYLPKLAGSTNSQYNSYKERALFYPAASRTTQGLVGAIFRKPPEITPEEGYPEYEKISNFGMSLPEFAINVAREVVMMGRYGIMVDAAAKETNRAYLVGYNTESIINWQTELIDGEEKTTLVVLKEPFYKQGDDRYTRKLIYRYRVLFLDENGYYKVEVYEKRQAPDVDNEPDVRISSFEPKIKGKRITEIPFKFVNTVDNTSTIYKSPISDVSDVNLSHYHSSADIEHGRHWTALPTVYTIGDDSEEAFYVGSPEVINLQNPDEIGMLEYMGQGLRALENALADKQKLMGVLGARLLEEPKRSVESAETHKLRKTSEDSILASVSKSVSVGLTSALQIWAEFSNKTDGAKIELNRDFVTTRLTPQEMSALLELRQEGAISEETFLYNLERGEILPEDRSAAEEKELLESDPNRTQPQSKAEVEEEPDTEKS